MDARSGRPDRHGCRWVMATDHAWVTGMKSSPGQQFFWGGIVSAQASACNGPRLLRRTATKGELPAGAARTRFPQWASHVTDLNVNGVLMACSMPTSTTQPCSARHFLFSTPSRMIAAILLSRIRVCVPCACACARPCALPDTPPGRSYRPCGGLHID